jgi:putative sigma-54 modulation protein
VQISFTARHFEVPPGLRQFATQRLEKLQKFATDIHGVHLVVVQEKARFQAEITMRLNGTQLVCTETHGEPGAAIERAADRLEEKLRRYKDRRVEHKLRKGDLPGAGIPGTDDDAVPGGEPTDEE